MSQTQWRPPPVSILRHPSHLLRLYGDTASEDTVKPSQFGLGLPTPIWPSADKPTPTEATIAAASRQGTQVHATIAKIATPAQHADLTTLDRLISQTLTTVVTGRNNGNLRRARLRVAGLVHQYTRVFLPPPTVEFHGSEIPVPGGRADLLWWHPNVGWFFDEVKTFRFAGDHELDYRPQVRKYLTAGAALGGDFAGVRLVSLGNINASRLYLPDGLTEPLLESALAPTALRADWTEGERPQ